MACLGRINSSSHSSENISEAPKVPWDPVGPGKLHLLNELEGMYWEGIKGELENIIRTLRIWQRSEFKDVEIKDETDDEIYGFDTFIDQVSQEARAYAIRYGEFSQQWTSISERYWLMVLIAREGKRSGGESDKPYTDDQKGERSRKEIGAL